MTTQTLTKTTDTPKATKAVRVVSPNVTVVTTKAVPTKAPSAPTKAKESALDIPAFVAAYKADSVSVATKARIIGKSIASGTETVAIIANALIAALESANLIVPKSFAASITHYATAYSAASKVKLSGDDAALHAAYQISTGVVKAKARDAFLESFNGESAEFVTGCRELIKAARAAKKAPKADSVTEPTVTAEKNLPEVISPLEDARKLLKQYRAILDLLVDNSPEDYSMAVDMVLEFSSEYEFEMAED